MNTEFLMELLRESSLSGQEHGIQKKWLDEVKGHTDQVEVDNIGNAYAILNPENNFKVMIAAHCDEIGFMVRKIDKKGFVYLEKVGGINPLLSLGMNVIIGENIHGVVGVRSEHSGGEKKDLEAKDIFIDCGFKDKEDALKFISIGDSILYDLNPLKLHNSLISSKALDNKTGLFIISEVLKELSKEKLSIGVIGASTVNEETNMGGAYFAGSRYNPNMAIALDVTFSGDYPRSEDLEIELGKGPVLAKGAPINRRINKHFEKIAEENNVSLQYELTPRNTGTDADVIRRTGRGVPVALVSLPLRYMHSPREVCSLEDIESEIKLLVESIKCIDENFNLCPID